MDRRFRFSRTVFLIVFTSLLAACSLPGGMQMAESPLLPYLERKSGLIVYVGNDGNIYTINQGGAQQTAITSDALVSPDSTGRERFYQFPTWTRDGKKIAFIGIDGEDNGLEKVTLFTALRDGQDLREIYSHERDVPFFLYWSPNGEQLGFLALAAVTNEYALQVVPAKGGEAQLIAKGSPLFWKWSPDNRKLLLHTGTAASKRPGSRLSLLSLEGGEEPAALDYPYQPAEFQTPDWSPDGRRLAVAVEPQDSEPVLLITDPAGKIEKTISDIGISVAFGWSPKGDQLAYITTYPGEGEDTQRVLRVMDMQAGTSAISTGDEYVLAFFWSPDGRKIAYFIPSLIETTDESGEVSQKLVLGLRILDVQSGEVYQAADFSPTEQFVNMLPFFDQYQRSATIWSPDSNYLVISVQQEDGAPGIYVVEPSANLQPRFIADGAFALWSWK